MSETFSKVEVITGVARRRRFTTEQKLSGVNETLQPGMSIAVALAVAIAAPGGSPVKRITQPSGSPVPI
jgi:hypothetical protein